MEDKYPRRIDLLCSGMIEITGHVVGEGVPDTIIRRVLECALEVFDPQGAYLITSWQKHELVKYSLRRGALRDRPLLVEKRILSALGGVSEQAYRERELVIITDTDREEGISAECDLLAGIRARSLVVAPLRTLECSAGVLGIMSKRGELLEPTGRRLVQLLADQAGVALEAAARHAEVEQLGFTDALTGVYNYRFLLEAIAREIERARRFDETFCVVMLDMDELKKYNDVHGHLRGSQVLKVAAKLAVGQLRAMDVMAKYGGDEFVVVLPQTAREGANLVAERMRRAIEEHPFPGEEETGPITSSLGIAVFPDDGDTVDELLDRADQALYSAKEFGKNRVAAGVAKCAGRRRSPGAKRGNGHLKTAEGR